MDENNNLKLQCWDIILFVCSNTNVVFPKEFSKYPFHNKGKLIWKHWEQNIYDIIRGVLGTIRKRSMKTSCKAMLKLCLVANNFGTFRNTIEAMGIHLFCCIHSGENPMMLFNFLHSLWKMRGFMFCKSKPTFSIAFLLVFFVDESTLFCQLMAFTHWPMLSLLTHLNKLNITSSSFSWGGCNTGTSNERKAFITTITQ